ncbi:14657_t:CDS:2 [Racocetra fulgida]|uniref:14657_t:CDS:1 n=1 Tax=Racocetra fulgida TaxID=60492 RepID=A0A9N8ZY12_9GLOM|nr:14657_t:CDS:2 [Racocetra fulgida]
MEILNNNFTSMYEETELEAFVSEEAELEAKIINLIEHLPIDDPLDSESEKEQEEIVKIGDAIIGLDNLIKYIQQNDLEITSSLIKELYSLKKYIIYLCNESKRQAILEEFINLMV